MNFKELVREKNTERVKCLFEFWSSALGDLHSKEKEQRTNKLCTSRFCCRSVKLRKQQITASNLVLVVLFIAFAGLVCVCKFME